MDRQVRMEKKNKTLGTERFENIVILYIKNVIDITLYGVLKRVMY